MGSDFRAKVDGKLYSAPEISSMIRRKLKKDAEDYIGEAVTDAVIKMCIRDREDRSHIR